MAPYLQHCEVDYLHTSGGRTSAGHTRVRAQERGNMVTWAQLHAASGRGIIADTGYGVGGKLEHQRDAWFVEANLRARSGKTISSAGMMTVAMAMVVREVEIMMAGADMEEAREPADTGVAVMVMAKVGVRVVAEGATVAVTVVE